MTKQTTRTSQRSAASQSSKGFTLIELLVVVAIIALLVSILLPSLSKAKEQTRIVVCMTNLKGLSTAFSLYVAENNGWYPPGAAWGGSGLEYTWDTVLQPYYEIYEILHCPSDNIPRPWVWGWGWGSTPKEYHYARSYAINPQVTWYGPSTEGESLNYNGNPAFPWPGYVRKPTNIPFPGETIILGEMWESTYYGSVPLPGQYHVFWGCGIFYGYPGEEATGYVHRNNDAANYLFCDGHVTILPEDTPELGLDGNGNYYYWKREK